MNLVYGEHLRDIHSWIGALVAKLLGVAGLDIDSSVHLEIVLNRHMGERGARAVRFQDDAGLPVALCRTEATKDPRCPCDDLLWAVAAARIIYLKSIRNLQVVGTTRALLDLLHRVKHLLAKVLVLALVTKLCGVTCLVLCVNIDLVRGTIMRG